MSELADTPGPQAHAPPGADPSVSRTSRLLDRIARRPWRALGIVALVAVLGFAWLSWSLPVSRALEPLPEPTLILLDSSGASFARRVQRNARRRAVAAGARA